jgi:hypothetical protein
MSNYIAFISHHKTPAAVILSAVLQDALEEHFGNDTVFLDQSKKHMELPILMQSVRNSAVMVVLLTNELLLQPECIAELYSAALAHLPFVVVCITSLGYDVEVSKEHLRLLD